MTKPKGWPRYMVERTLSSGIVGYFWYPTARDRKAGCVLEGRALGRDYSKAKEYADELNEALDAWRKGHDVVRQPAGFGTVRWWLEHEYKKTRAWKQNSNEWKLELHRHIMCVCDLPLSKPKGALRSTGDFPVSSITARAADKLYERLSAGRERQGEIALSMLKKAWTLVQRLHPEKFPTGNPFDNITRVRRARSTKRPASVVEAYALAEALYDAGHPGLGAAALICFEWHRRPENVLSGKITWADYRPGESVRIAHHKTGKQVELILRDEEGPLYPEIEHYLSRVPRIGLPVALTPSDPPKPYKKRRANEIIARVRTAARLAEDLTIAACRHGGLTELGDAELTEAEGMALSAHSSPANLRLYVKATDRQRLSGARKRRAFRTKLAQESK